jgi:hypothetical protein
MKKKIVFREHVSTTVKAQCGVCRIVNKKAELLFCSKNIELEYHKAGTDYRRFFPAFAEKMRLWFRVSADVEEMHWCLRTGGAAPRSWSKRQRKHIRHPLHAICSGLVEGSDIKKL